MTPDDSWPSTKALSVYNALSLAGADMTANELVAFLRECFDPRIGPEYVAEGIAFLNRKRFAVMDGQTVVIQRSPQGRGRKLMRINEDADLVMLPKWNE